MVLHLTQRVAWSDSRWSGRMCDAPSQNGFCLSLKRIRETKDDGAEDGLAGQSWAELSANQLPPCHMEAGGFMNSAAWTRLFRHPYAEAAKAASTHGALRPTSIPTPPFSTYAVPFRWMLRENQPAFDEQFPEILPPDEDPPWHTAWVFGRARQSELLDRFFGRIAPQQSLVFYYCKEGHPLGETLSRVLVGVGRITSISGLLEYEVERGPTYPMWDRKIGHSIREDGDEGFLLPYHAYLAPTGDADEDVRRRELLAEVVVAVDPAHSGAFSYGSEHATSDIALSILVRCLEAVRAIRRHGIAEGPWAAREEWLDEQIAAAWQDRGPFPGVGAMLSALGMRLGTALSLELRASGQVGAADDPWPIVAAILKGERAPPQQAYKADLQAVHGTWMGLSDERRALLVLLSRFSLSLDQAHRIWDKTKRARGFSVPVTDLEILENPYRICEVDLGDLDDAPVSVGVIDRGLWPSDIVRQAHPTPAPSAIESPQDPRRVRAAIVTVLRRAADEGDALLSSEDVRTGAAVLDLEPPCLVAPDWIAGNLAALEGVVETVTLVKDEAQTTALQLHELGKREDQLRRWLSKRAVKLVNAPAVDWSGLITKALTASGRKFDPKNARHADARAEQAQALAKLVSRKLSVLTGGAGTGKTTVLGALMLCEELAQQGFLLLAPTGKARVRLGNATKAEASTVAQFLNQLGRYDLRRQRPLFDGAERYRGAKTIIIDESSMLTMDDLYAVFAALDLAHVQRIILVGDPNQLPPIGVGRPFADLIAWLESAMDAETGPLAAALGRLTVEVRTAPDSDVASHTLRLASWFTREPPPVDADRVLSDLQDGGPLNDLEIRYWKTPHDLRAQLLEALQAHLGLTGPNDIEGFDRSLGIEGQIKFSNPNGSERWQILSPVRMQPYGVLDLNRWIQTHFHGQEVSRARKGYAPTLGDEMIVAKDKVIQTVNENRRSYDWKTGEASKVYIANGEIGVMASVKGKLSTLFADRPDRTFNYSSGNFSEGRTPLQLAYALTIHKAQGSEFGTVFVVLPKTSRLLSRELAYTALTRSRQRLVLLVEGDGISALWELSKPEKSETARRNSNLFTAAVRASSEETPYPEHLIHRTRKGHLVRSKSEFIIANLLHELGVDYDYERPLLGEQRAGRMHPDFSFTTDDGDIIIWEHLGMMDRADYRQGWDWKKQWYADNGFDEGKNLFVTTETRASGLDDLVLRKVAAKIGEALRA